MQNFQEQLLCKTSANRCFFGSLIKDMVEPYLKDILLKHVLFLFWKVFLYVIAKKYFILTKSNLIRREEKSHTLYQIYYIRVFILIMIKTFSFAIGYEVLFISVVLQASSNEIESNIVICRMCLVARRVRKKSKNKNTKWGNSRSRYGCMVLNK